MRKFRELEQIIEKEMGHFPEVGWSIDMKYSKHKRLILEHNGESRFIVMPGSPGEIRGLKNKVRDIRREAARLGATRR